MSLSTLLAGPIIKHVDQSSVCIWIATSVNPDKAWLKLYQNNKLIDFTVNLELIVLSDKLFVSIFNAQLSSNNSCTRYEYDFCPDSEHVASDTGLLVESGIGIQQGKRPFFNLSNELKKFAHASCRKPHGNGKDAFVPLAYELSESSSLDALFLTGDQIYADDVDRFMFDYVRDVIVKLELPAETFTGCEPPVPSRAQWLKDHANFTSGASHCHLMTLSEFAAMHLLAFSPQLWPEKIQPHLQDYYQGCKAIQKVMAHVPTYFMFDDHEVTDDWFLDEAWRSEVERTGIGKQIICNALSAFGIFQYWGNCSDFPQLKVIVDFIKNQNIEAMQQELMSFDWSYTLATQPPAYVMDTHTQRYGFGDTMHLRHPDKFQKIAEFTDKQIILVSPAPVFGIPALEKIQDFIAHTFNPVKVDYERWFERAFRNLMDSVLKNGIENVIILSGDYHYAMNIQAKIERPGKPLNIYQLVSSSSKNSEPKSWALNLLSALRNILRFSTKGKGDLEFYWSLRRLGSLKWPTVLSINNVGIVQLNDDGSRVTHSLLSPTDDKVKSSRRLEVTFEPDYWKNYKLERWAYFLGIMSLVIAIIYC